MRNKIYVLGIFYFYFMVVALILLRFCSMFAENIDVLDLYDWI